jgi:tryptophan 7-halogenase
MHVCIIGSGASGLLAACAIRKLHFVKKITIIESKKIHSIKVGESTTAPFFHFVDRYIGTKEFVTNSDATVKYGVLYDNWSPRQFIHYFDDQIDFNLDDRHNFHEYMLSLANKDPNVHIHDLIAKNLWKIIQNNQFSSKYAHTWHFDAGKLKIFLKKELSKDNKIEFVYDTIIYCKHSFYKTIKFLIGENNSKYTADYYINCCGENDTNQKVFKEEYVNFSSYLLTNKAWVYPLQFKDKQTQFTPYTTAKTMKYGWRWITPTQSRIGTGYVFSDNYVSPDQALDEFLADVGDKTIKPFLVDFNPKINKQSFKTNNCSLGMSSGFLEPLDAPGLSATIGNIYTLLVVLTSIHEKNIDIIQMENIYASQPEFEKLITESNEIIAIDYEWWCSFILHQYKTCWRNDTDFWIDHKNVNCYFYDDVIKNLTDCNLNTTAELEMFYKTTAGKDIQWKSNINKKPIPMENDEKTIDKNTIHHLEYIESFYH